MNHGAYNTDPNQRQVNPEISGPRPMPSVSSPVNPSSNSVPSLPASMVVEPAKKHIPLIPIIIALVVAILLIGVTVFVFVKSGSKPKSDTNNLTTKEDEKKEEGRVTVEDIETAKKDIDQNLTNINDSTDFHNDDLSDATLGL